MNASELGHRLRDRRQALDLDQRTLAEIAGVSVHTLSNLESGLGNPTVRVLERVGTALGLELVWQVRTPSGLSG